MLLKKSLLVLCLLALLFMLPIDQAVQARRTDHIFGVVESYYRPDEAAKLGLQWERVTFPWYALQPSGSGDFNPGAIPDNFLSPGLNAGREIVGLIKGTPGWASSTGSLGAVPNGLSLPYNDPNNVFGVFMTRLVQFYSAHGIHNWIVWNEPDIRPGEGIVEFEGEVADYAQLLKVAYLAAHAVDPAAHIQIAGLSWWYDVQHGRSPYLKRLLEAIASDPEAKDHNHFFDGISVHIYFTTSSVWDILNRYRTILARAALGGKEIWLTEYNASPRRDPQALIQAPFNISLEQQADFVVQASALALAAGVDRMAIYKMYDSDFKAGLTEPWGLVRADGSLRPAYFAYQQVIREFSRAGNVQHFSTHSATLVALDRGDNTLYVMWSNTFAPGQFIIPARDDEPKGIVYDAAGNLVDSTGNRSAGFLYIDAPAAEQIDLPDVVVGGPVRIISLSGPMRHIKFRNAAGDVANVN